MYARKRKLKEAHSTVVEENSNVGNKSTGINLVQLRYEMYEMFYHSSAVSLIDMLNGSSCDEILEIDINNDTFKQFYHVDGKYFVPAVGLSYKDLIEFTYNYVVHPDDRATYMGLMGIDGFFERIKNNRIPNFDFAHFRYKLQDGTYGWVEQVVIAGEEFRDPVRQVNRALYDAIKEIAVVADDEHCALEAQEVFLQPFGGAQVEVVRRLVEQQDVRVLEDEPRQIHARFLPAGEALERLRAHFGGNVQTVGHAIALKLHVIPAAGAERLLQPVILLEQRGIIVLRHAHRERSELFLDRIQRAVRVAQHVLGRPVLRVDRDLGDEPQPSSGGDADLAGVRQQLAAQKPEERGFAAAVAAEDPDALPGVHVERDAV